VLVVLVFVVVLVAVPLAPPLRGGVTGRCERHRS
jgi:hypothetical protein